MNNFDIFPIEIICIITKKCHYIDTLYLNMTCKLFYFDINLKSFYRKPKDLPKLVLLGHYPKLFNECNQLTTLYKWFDIIDQFKSFNSLDLYFPDFTFNEIIYNIHGTYVFDKINKLKIKYNKEITSMQVKQLADVFPNIEELNIYHMHPILIEHIIPWTLKKLKIDCHFNHFNYFDHCLGLTSLKICNSFILNNVLLTTLHKMSNLKILHLIRCYNINKISDISIVNLKIKIFKTTNIEITNLSNLKVLIINQIMEQKMPKSIIDLLNTNNLTTIKLRDCVIRNNFNILSHLTKLDSDYIISGYLDKLISFELVSDDIIFNCNCFERMVNLSKLNIYEGYQIDNNIDAIYLQLSKLKNLTELILGIECMGIEHDIVDIGNQLISLKCTSINEKLLKKLTQLKKLEMYAYTCNYEYDLSYLRKLETLKINIRNTEITWPFCSILTGLNIKKLKLYKCYIDNFVIKQLTSLTHIHFIRCNNIEFGTFTHLINLKKIDIGECYYKSQSINFIQHLPNLYFLNFNDSIFNINEFE